MNGRYLLDTNILIALFANEQSIIDQISQAAELFLPSIVVGELYYGAEKSGRKAVNLRRIDQLITTNTILECDARTARIYGAIKNQLKERGRPIPENDIWIAAITQQYQLTLVTRDTHFESIDSLDIVVW